ncbi:hypothetical protein [Roseovarius amoyensis]|uniref:hypothetical protein n=1 Tax=Roseovarius amoyensis TaxID=2211448 RepID=UPI0013A6FE1C|nr:hypothetical protein [Roseovarius amoyensis]
MRLLAMTAAIALVPALAGAETLRSANLEADLTRRVVSMTSRAGAAIKGEQVYVTMRRLDGAAMEAADLTDYVGFAERAACGTRSVLVSLMVGVEAGAARYEVLCASAE